MNKAKRLSNNLLPIISLSVLILIGILFAVKAAYANVSFHTADENFSGYENSLNASSDDTYPYNSDTATINKVSLDVMYGTTRGLTYYHGEFPYDCIYDDDDEYEEGWEGYYAEDGTSATGDNPSYGASATVNATDYWGTGVSEDWFANVPTAEQVNDGTTTSLRLYANAHTITGFGRWLSAALYTVVKFFAWVATLLIGLIVRAKNISMDLIMDILHLDDLNDAMTKNFIWDGDHLKLSAFTGFCIIILIFTLAAFAVRWVRGRDKTQGIWEIIGTIALGLIIIGMCLTGRISSLGSSVSTVASKVMYSVAQSLNTGGDGDAFVIDITDAENETEITQMCEMALVNKAFIDLQLCSQFDVSSVDDLKFDKFGDPNGTNAASYLSGVSSASMKDDFNNNLGYYYWFADSSAVQKTSKNKTMPSTDTQSIHNKLSSIMTYLQVQYNANSSNADVSERIVGVVGSFAHPGGGPRFLCLLLFAIVLVMMAVVLFKYALNVIIAKIQLFIALLGMIVAGPLILTSNKKLVETGKAILGMLLVSFLEITVYSIIFDLIIYTVSAMFAPNIMALIAVFALLMLLLYFNPVIAQKIKQIMERTERKISPALVDGRRAAKNWAKGKARDAVGRYDSSEKVVGYDNEGNAITEKRGGNALSKLMHTGTNAVFAEGNEHEGLIGMHTKLNEERQQNKAKSAKAIREEAEAAVERKRSEIYDEAAHKAKAINADAKTIENETKLGVDENGETIYDENKLSEEERRMVADRRTHKDELEELENNGDYQDLVNQQKELDKINAKLKEGESKQALSTDDAARLAAYKQKIGAKRAQIMEEKKKVEETIKLRAQKEAMAAKGLNYDEAKGKDFDEKLANATNREALNNHRDELEKTLNASIAAMSNEVNNTTTQGKIGRGSTQTLNKEAAEAQAAAMLQLDQLQHGEDVMAAHEAKKEIADIVDKVSQHYDKDRHSDDARIREHLYNEMEKAAHGGTTDEYKAAKEAYNREVERQNANHKAQKQEVKGQYKDAKADAGRVVTKATVQEQLQSAINNRERGTSAPTDSTTAPSMSNVVSAQEAQAPKASTSTPSGGQNVKLNIKQPQTQAKPNMYTNPVQQPQAQPSRGGRPNAVESLNVEMPTPAKPGGARTAAPARPTASTQPQVDMGAVIGGREAVTSVEARQAESRNNMNNIIEERTKSISHGTDATKADYAADESKMDAMNQDRRIVRNIYGEDTTSGGRQ